MLRWLVFWLKAIRGTRSLEASVAEWSLVYALQLELCKTSPGIIERLRKPFAVAKVDVRIGKALRNILK